MKQLILSDDGISLKPDTANRLLSRCYFPENDDDFQDYLLLLNVHERRYPPGNPAPKAGAISNAIDKVILQRSSRLVICGCVAIAMCENHMAGKKLGLNSASKTVSNMAYVVKTGSVESFQDGKVITKNFRLTADPTDVKKAFREYLSVAHICAARISLNYNEVADGQQYPSELDTKRLVRTAIYFQHCLEKLDGAKNWKLWDVSKTAPLSLDAIEPCIPTPELISDIFEPIENGK